MTRLPHTHVSLEHCAESEKGQEAMLLHNRIAGLLGMKTTICELNRILMKPDLTSGDITALRTYVGSLPSEIDWQVYDAMNFLSAWMPDSLPGLLRPEIANVNPVHILEELLPPYRMLAGERRIAIELKIDDVFPSIVMDTGSIRRAFHNILTNAIKYSYSSTSETNRFISIRGRRHDAHGLAWRLQFQNYGVGILPSESGQLFSPGARGSLAIKEHRYGSGLGLADVKRTMELHRGSVAIRSVHEHGNTYVTTVDLIMSSAGYNRMVAKS